MPNPCVSANLAAMAKLLFLTARLIRTASSLIQAMVAGTNLLRAEQSVLLFWAIRLVDTFHAPELRGADSRFTHNQGIMSTNIVCTRGSVAKVAIFRTVIGLQTLDTDTV